MFTELSIIGVALLWGITNPLLRKGSEGIQTVTSDSKFKRTLLEVQFLFTNWNYLIPFIVNQLGSVLYFFTLQNTNLSLIVPVANSLTFLFTSLASLILGEKVPNKRKFLGMFLIVTGAACCFLDKSET